MRKLQSERIAAPDAREKLARNIEPADELRTKMTPIAGGICANTIWTAIAHIKPLTSGGEKCSIRNSKRKMAKRKQKQPFINVKVEMMLEGVTLAAKSVSMWPSGNCW